MSDECTCPRCGKELDDQSKLKVSIMSAIDGHPSGHIGVLAVLAAVTFDVAHNNALENGGAAECVGDLMHHIRYLAAAAQNVAEASATVPGDSVYYAVKELAEELASRGELAA